jgi:ATP-dependent Clp protease ATP-binding subunit ClpA
MEQILRRAAEIAKAQTGQAFIGTENVLRALVEDDDGIAAVVLRELDVAERVAARLDEIMASESYRTPSRRVFPPDQ